MAKKDKPIAFYGIQNAKYCLRDASGKIGAKTAVDLPKGKSLVLNPEMGEQDVYADNSKLFTIISDQGYKGNYACTGQDEDFEEALGLMVTLDSKLTIGVKLTESVRFDLYFEYIFKPEGKKPFVMKTWVYGVELGKPARNHATNTNTVAIGEYQYPLTAYGEKVMKADGSVYRNENGFELYALYSRSIPGDDNYEGFEDKVPEPIAEAA